MLSAGSLALIGFILVKSPAHGARQVAQKSMTITLLRLAFTKIDESSLALPREFLGVTLIPASSAFFFLYSLVNTYLKSGF
jgi:hypothetical protein